MIPLNKGSLIQHFTVLLEIVILIIIMHLKFHYT